MWNMILLCIVQCAIGTRNRETTVHIHTHTMQMIRYPSYVLHWCTVLKCTKIGGGKCMRTHCGTVCSRSDKPTDKQTAGWYVSGWCVTVRGKPQASLVVTQMQAHHITQKQEHHTSHELWHTTPQSQGLWSSAQHFTNFFSLPHHESHKHTSHTDIHREAHTHTHRTP